MTKTLFELMAEPDFYHPRPERVEVIQTHISFIFLAGDSAYKVKKAVDYGFLDFTTLEKRRFYCERELELNRRLAPDVYRAVVPITKSSGRYALGGEGTAVEYTLWMRRLPEERMLKKIIGTEQFDPAVMDVIAAKVAAFHRRAATGGEIDTLGSIETIRHNHEENFVQSRVYIGQTITPYAYRFIRSFAENFLEANREFFASRLKKGRIRDGHGDLHLEHIIVGDDDITIFDCIEFNDRFRCGDVAAEVAFLAMDLDFNGFPAEGERFVRSYVRESGDEGVMKLLDFYRCYYAYVRGKVVSFRLDDPSIPPEEKEAARKTAARYFDLAYSYAARPSRPIVVVMAGLMGTGKSVLAGRIAPRLDAAVIRTDVLRKELLSIETTERRYEPFGEGIYRDDISRLTYEEALRRAVKLLEQGKSVIIDASYKRREERRKVFEAIQKARFGCYLIECVCPEEIVRERLVARAANPGEPSDGRWELYEKQRDDFDPITELTAVVRIDTSGSIEACEEEALTFLKHQNPY